MLGAGGATGVRSAGGMKGAAELVRGAWWCALRSGLNQRNASSYSGEVDGIVTFIQDGGAIMRFAGVLNPTTRPI